MKRSLASAAALLAVCALAGCAPRAPRRAPKDVLYRHLEGDPATLDPITTTEENGIFVEEMMFRPLLGLDVECRPMPALAVSWAVSPDGLAYEFRLDPGAQWEDGSPVTSEDVLFTLERIRDPKVPAFNYRDSFSDVVAIETPDPSTVRVRFRASYAERLVAFNLPIVSRAAYSAAKSPADLDRRPSGSGPYRLERWVTNQTIALVGREDAAETRVPFRRMVFRVIPDPTVRFRAGTRGDLDEFRISRDQVAAARSSRDFLARNQILKVPQPIQAYVLWNVRHPFLADPRVRTALAHCWPREDAARRLYPPDGAALVSGPYLPGAPENDPTVRPAPYDPGLAARLLDEAGWRAGSGGTRMRGGRKASLELLYPSGRSVYNALAEILRSSTRARRLRADRTPASTGTSKRIARWKPPVERRTQPDGSRSTARSIASLPPILRRTFSGGRISTGESREKSKASRCRRSGSFTSCRDLSAGDRQEIDRRRPARGPAGSRPLPGSRQTVLQQSARRPRVSDPARRPHAAGPRSTDAG